MANVVAWSVLALGVGHIVFGLITFKVALAETVRAGLIGHFHTPEVRRTAFWFLMCGPLLMLAGHSAIHAVAVADRELLIIIGTYAFVAAIVGLIAFPKSPFWALLVLAPLLIAAGYGVL